MGKQKHPRDTGGGTALRAGRSQRPLRVGEEMRHAISEILMRGEIRDPVLRETSVTVTEVRASPDLRHAVVFVMPLGGRGSGDVLSALERAGPWLRGQVTRMLRLKFAPQFEFRLDTSFDEASHIATLLRRPGVAIDLTQPEDDEDAKQG